MHSNSRPKAAAGAAAAQAVADPAVAQAGAMAAKANLHHPVAGSSRLRRETMVGKGSYRPPVGQANRNSHLRANSARSPRLPRRARANCRPTHNRRPAGLTAPPTGNLMTQLAFRLPQAR